MDNLPPSGVRLVAQGAELFQRVMQQATAAIQKQGEAAEKAASKSVTGNTALGKAISSLQDKYLKLVPGGQASIDMLTQFAGSLGVSTAAALAMVAAVAALAAAFVALGTRGSTLIGLAESFDRLTASVGVASQTLLVDLRKAAAGTVSDFDLIRRANVALAGATGEFGQQFAQNLPKILEIARTQARATGQDVDFLFQSLVTGIKRASPLLIDNTGITLKISEANQTLAEQLGKTVEQLTSEEKQIAVLNATLEAGDRAIAALGDSHETAAEKMARAQATVTNILDRLGLAVQPGFEAVLDGVNRILGVVEKLAGAFGTLLSPIVEIFGNTFKTAVDVALGVLDPFINAILSFVPYIAIVFQFISDVISRIFGIIVDIVGRIVGFLKDVAKNTFGLDLENLGPQLFNGAARAFGAFANGIITAANQLIFPAVISIATFIADFLVGFSPPKKGPLSKIDQGGANVMSAWLGGLIGVPLDPVKKVAAEVSAALGSIGKASLPQVNARLAQLDKALLPFQNRLSIIKAQFDAIAEPAKLALDAIDRQMGTALEALARGEAGSDAVVRRLDAQRASIQAALDTQQGITDAAQIQLALATAQQSRERALLAIRKAQLEAAQKTQKADKTKPEKAPGEPKPDKLPKGTGGTVPEVPAGIPGTSDVTNTGADSVLDMLTGGVEEAKQGLIDAFSGEIDTSQLSLLQENTGKLQEQLGRLSGVDLGGALKEKFQGLVDSVFNPETAGSPAAILKDLLDSITNPTRPGSVPYFFNTTLPANIDSATATISERVSKLFDSIFNPNTEGSPAAVAKDLLDSIANPDREGSIPYFFNNTLPEGIDSAKESVENGLRGFFNLFDPNAKDSPAASVKKFVETLFGDSETDGSIAHFFATLPDNISAALAGLPAIIESAFDPNNEASPFYSINQNLQTLLGDSETEGSIANWFSMLPESISTALDELPTKLTEAFQSVTDFFTGTGPNTLADIINQGVQWFVALPGAIISVLQGLGLSIWNSVAVPVITTINSLIDVAQTALGNLARSIAQFIIDNIETPASNLGVSLPQALLDFRASLMTARIQIPHISLAAPAFLTAAPGGATGGLFGEGIMRVGERGQELVASAGRMAVFPNQFVQALDRLTETLIAQPVGLPVAGSTYNDSHNINATFNGVSGANDVMRRFARLKASR